MNEIGKLIYTRRKELGLTLEEVGDAVGVGKSTVRKWENGTIQNIGNDKLAKLADVLQINPVNLVPCDGERKTEYIPPHTVEARSLAKGVDSVEGCEGSNPSFSVETPTDQRSAGFSYSSAKLSFSPPSPHQIPLYS